MKRAATKIGTFLTVLILLVSLCLSVSAESVAYSGTCGPNLTWKYEEETKTLTISGTGPMDDFEMNATPWYHFFPYLDNVVVEPGVTTIGDFAFCNSWVYHVSLPDGLLSIGEWAFYFNLLEELDIPDSVVTIEASAFENAGSIRSIVIPQGVTEIPQYAFAGLYSLTDIKIPDGVTYIGPGAFSGCTTLEKVDLPDGLTEIHAITFMNTALTHIDLPESITSIGGSAFGGCLGLTHVTIPESVTSISGSFRDCRNLVSVSLPDGLKTIGEGTFVSCESLAEVIIPAGLETLGESAFWGCKSLRSVVIPGGIKEIPMGAFEHCENLSFVKIEEGITSIDTYAFKDCKNLGYLTIPASVEYVGGFAFSNCDAPNGYPFVLTFLGDAPEFYEAALMSVTVQVTYPAGNDTWHGIEDQSIGGYPTFRTSCEPHTFGDWQTVHEPSVSVEGIQMRNCTQCRHAEFQLLPKRQSIPFSDISWGKYYTDPVLWAVDKGITTGTGDGTTFSPNDPCTRKQIVTFLWRAAGEPEPASMENPFKDVKHDRFEKAILWAYYAGITTGTTDTTFSPNATCTRKQIVTFLWRFNGEPLPESGENPFGDVKEDRFIYAILWAYYSGITTGKTDTTFEPESPCTRAQIVTFLYRNMVG